MFIPHGVIQGYYRIAAVDEKNQVVVGQEACGNSADSKQFLEILDGIKADLLGFTVNMPT